ncbi:MAG: PDZ domain-containing protein [Deltaproteobacteria bacterium]|nr:PDZ domain-containing protein [Deltaproteobacteria bacterium]
MVNKRFFGVLRGVLLLNLGMVLWSLPALAASKVPDGKDHNLAKAEVMDRTILAVMEDYYDSSRIAPLEMFKGAMGELVKAVAEVKVTYDAAKAATIEVLGNKLEVSLEAVNSPWGLSKTFHRIFSFLKNKLPVDENLDYRTIEYAAVNGLLATLDPHTSAMTPDVWEELRMSTRGAFEGIGIRITTDYRTPCDGDLTVVEVFDGTPAQKAGLKVGDKIIRIEDDSTVNITTSEAADQLRGEPGTEVKVGILRRDGSHKTLHIVRQRIPIDSVKWKMMDGNVGYMELTAFQQGSAGEMESALEQLHEKNMKGLVLDLRGNPGGLLDAAIDIANLFISSGTLVTTAGRNRNDRDVTNADAQGTEPKYPIVILIDGYTASAAEILSGALRNHGRALLIGETTFGKGSVQNIISLPDDGAMRLTIQQYLIPGDISIQAVGVAPDISFVPSVVDKKEMLVSRRERTFSEASLDAHLVRASKIERGDRPGALRMPYFVSAKQRQEDMALFKQCYSEDMDRKSYRNQYEVEFARRLIAETAGVTTAEMLVTARKMIENMGKKELEAMQQALRRLGVDWSDPENAVEVAAAEMIASQGLDATVKLDNAAEAGKDFKFTVTVKNRGQKAIHRLRARTVSDNPYLAGIDLVFGKLAPGKTRKWTATVSLPPVVSSRVDPMEIVFYSTEGAVPKKMEVNVPVTGRRKPRLVYNWTMNDEGNGNGYIEPGEKFTVYLRVTNEGEGATFKSEANLSSRAGLDIESGRFVMKSLKPGESAKGVFVISAPAEKLEEMRKVEVSLTFDEWVPMKMPSLLSLQQQSFALSVYPEKAGAEAASGTVTVQNARIPIFTVPSKDEGIVLGYAEKDASFQVDATVGEFFRLSLDKNTKGWVERKLMAPGGKGDSGFLPLTTQLPLVELNSKDAVLVKGDVFSLKGKVAHPSGLRDVLVFVGGEKVEYEQVMDSASEKAFAFNVPLEIGANVVSVIARHDRHTVASENIFVRRTE